MSEECGAATATSGPLSAAVVTGQPGQNPKHRAGAGPGDTTTDSRRLYEKD